MEHQEYTSLSLTTDYFEKLLFTIQNLFMEKHKFESIPKSTQFFGYGNYDESKPNLKKELESISSDFVNGKYLYDKTREFHKGKPIIKINNYYKSLILVYLGYDDIKTFIDEQELSDLKLNKQLSLIYDDKINQTYYYLNYYFGEDNTIIKGQTVISNNWKKIHHTYIYRQDDGTIKEHYNYGGIIRREDTIHINTKTLLDGKLVEGASEIYYIGHNDPSNVNFLIGNYCAFDMYTNTVAGKIILEKCESKEDMESKSLDETIPPYIALEIRNKRIINQGIVPKHYLELSENSPYSSIYGKIPGTYTLIFHLENGFKETLKFKINSTNFKTTPLMENVYFEEDNLELLNKGSIIHFNFKFAGIIALNKVDIYFKTYYLKQGKEKLKGTFSGIDNENRLVSGQVSIDYSPNSL